MGSGFSACSRRPTAVVLDGAHHNHQRPLCSLHRCVAGPLLAGLGAAGAIRIAGRKVREGPTVARLLRAREEADEEREASALACGKPMKIRVSRASLD